MSNYGPPGGPYPGQPPEPWHGRGRHDPYGQPPPYGPEQSGYPPYAQPGYDDHGGYGPAHAYEEPYPPVRPAPAWTDPDPLPPDPGGRTAILVLVVVLALLVLGGGGAALYVLGRDEEPASAQASAQSSSPAPSQASRPTAPSAGTPAPQSSTDARFVKAGQCVKNEGGTGKPRLVITKCGAKTYQVLARIDGATTGERDAKAKCGKVEGYTDWYFFNSELDVLDFVLCLKLR
jgi:hypothetical protein